MTRPRPPALSIIKKAIRAFIDADAAAEVASDEFERWEKHEPRWITEQTLREGQPCQTPDEVTQPLPQFSTPCARYHDNPSLKLRS
jgi:hypothetical protein